MRERGGERGGGGREGVKNGGGGVGEGEEGKEGGVRGGLAGKGHGIALRWHTTQPKTPHPPSPLCNHLYSLPRGLAYGDVTKGNGFIGSNSFALSGWYSNANPSGGKGRWAEWFFQWAFAATATTIPAGAVAERFNFNAYLAYTVLVSAWVYPVVVHWAWAPKGWLSAFNTVNPLFGSGMIDFAGCAVVHMVR